MAWIGFSRTREIETVINRRGAIAKLRRAYFAQGGELAARYRISFDRVIQHLWEARSFNRKFLLRAVCCVEDVIHAAACVDDVGLAWSDLAEQYERALVRRCRVGQDEIQSTIMVRKMIADLRRRRAEDSTFSSPTLRSYAGMRPLRSWLADRLHAARAREALTQQRWKHSRRPNGLTLPIGPDAAIATGVLDRAAEIALLRLAPQMIQWRGPALALTAPAEWPECIA